MKNLLLVILLMTSTQAFAELPDRIMELVGNYHSEKAHASDEYLESDHADFEIIINPNHDAIVHFPEWDHEFELEKDLTFGDSDVTECDDVGCSGVSEIIGEIKFVTVNGKEVPQAKVTLYFYADIIEDIDCDVVNCDDMDYEDFYKEWDKTFTYTFKGSNGSQLPTFKPVNVSKRWLNNMGACLKLVKQNSIKCSKISQYNFNKEIDLEEVKKLNQFLGTSFKKMVSKKEAVALMESHFTHELLLAKTFDYQDDQEQFKKIKANFDQLINMMKYSRGDMIFMSLGYGSSWGAADRIEFLFVNEKLKTIKKFQLLRRR